VGGEDSVYGLDASGNVWNLPFNTHTWQSTALSPMAELSVVSSTNIYGLQTDSAFCGPPEMRIYQYTGGTDFAKVSYCALHISAASDGSLYRIRSSGNVTHFDNATGTWIADTSAGGNGTPKKIVVGSASNVWLITSTGVIKTLNSSGSFVVVPGTATDITTSGDPSASTVGTFIVGPMANSNNVYKYSSATGATNGTWTALIGVLDKISSGGMFSTMGIRQSLNSVFHFNSLRISFSAQTTGYYDCSVFTNGCPVGSTHTATTKVTFNSGGHSQTATSSGAPSANLNASITPFTDDCDPIFGSPNDPVCQFVMSGQVQCSAMGAIFLVGFPTIKIHWGHDFMWYDAPVAYPGNMFHNKCQWAMADPTQCRSVTETGIDPIYAQCFPQTSGTAPFYKSMLDIVRWVEFQVGNTVDGVGFNSYDTKEGSMSPPEACSASPAHWGSW
jgi:hypothetical protein